MKNRRRRVAVLSIVFALALPVAVWRYAATVAPYVRPVATPNATKMQPVPQRTATTKQRLKSPQRGKRKMPNVIAQGATSNLEFTEASGESSNDWYVQKNEIPIATQSSPGAWNLVWDGTHLTLTVPADAVIGDDYNAVHLDGSSTQRTSAGGFEIIAAPAIRTPKAGMYGRIKQQTGR